MTRCFGWLKAISLLLVFHGYVQAGVPPEWRESAYAYEAVDQPLVAVLQDFANAHGVALSADRIDGIVSVKLRAASAEEFLERLALEYEFQWFVYNYTLYVSAQARQASARIEVSADAAPDLKQALTDIGLLDKRFGWGELQVEGVVLVTGPERYIEFIRQFSREKPKEDDKQRVMRFPLRYASAVDRVLKYREQDITIPGVASILEGLVGSARAPMVSPAYDLQSNVRAMERTADLSRNRLVNMVTSQEAPTASPRALSGPLAKKVSADVRNNAVLIYDDSEKRAHYQHLIEQLDLPSNLVEIDAIIIDVERNQLNDLGSRWSARFGGVGLGGSVPGAGASTLFIRDFGRFNADIQAMEARGVASVIGRPSVLTLDNHPALIDFSRTQYITATGERVAQIEPVTAGTSLRVIPRSMQGESQSRIQLVVDIEDGQLERVEGQDNPVVKRGVVSTQAVIGENRSLVIGGFQVDERYERNARVPFLGSIPLIGSLFRSVERQVSDRERLFILTPRLVGDQRDPLRYIRSGGTTNRREALVKWVHEKDRAQNLRAEIGQAFAKLAGGSIPVGITAQSTGARLGSLCQSSAAFRFDHNKTQWFSAGQFVVVVGVVTNISDKPKDFSLTTCNGPQTLASAVISSGQLPPGGSRELMVALRSAEGSPHFSQPSRESLLP